jgi:hypothetical protein
MRQTPYYVFDTDEFAKRAAMIRAALDCKGGRRIPLCFSIKANPFLLHRLPEGLDHVEVCSPGELEICIALGVKPESIIYSGVMKEKCDIERAVSYGAEYILLHRVGSELLCLSHALPLCYGLRSLPAKVAHGRSSKRNALECLYARLVDAFECAFRNVHSCGLLCEQYSSEQCKHKCKK